jgi:hypothetical protein
MHGAYGVRSYGWQGRNLQSTPNSLLDRLRQPVPGRYHALQIGVKQCHIVTATATTLQRRCSAPALAEFARAIAVSGYADLVRRFKSNRPSIASQTCPKVAVVDNGQKQTHNS